MPPSCIWSTTTGVFVLVVSGSWETPLAFRIVTKRIVGIGVDDGSDRTKGEMSLRWIRRRVVRVRAQAGEFTAGWRTASEPGMTLVAI